MTIDLYIEVENCPDGLEEFLSDVAKTCFEVEGVERSGFTVRIVDDTVIRDLNREQRGIDRVTDVLSFPTVTYPEGKYAGDVPNLLKREYDPSLRFNNLGDCVLNIDRARLQAQEFGHSLRRELGYLTAHSAFHLMGYDHMTDEDKRLMRSREKLAMEKLELFKNEKKETYAMNINESVIHEMLDKARAVRLNAYAPYSKFKVGACMLTKNGNMYVGANFENAAFGAGTCAERCAIAACVAAGDHEIAAVAVVADYAAWPCGICRQAIREFCVSTDIPVFAAGYQDDGYVMHTLEELLPNSFGPDALDNIIN